MLACLLAWYWQRNYPCEFAENWFVNFDQSSHVIFHTWYCQLYFFLWIQCGYPVNGSVKDFFLNHRGVNIIQFCSISVNFGSIYIFLFQSLDVELQKIFLLLRFFSRISCNKGLKAKISCFFTYFFTNVLEAERLLRSWCHIGWRNKKSAFTELHEWSENVVNVENC